MNWVLLAGLALGPLLLARMAHLKPAPGGIVVSPTAPKLDMEVVVDSSPDNPVVKPLVASLTGMRPQPTSIVIEEGATPTGQASMTVVVEPQVVFATPEALDRIAAALVDSPRLAVFPWQKTSSRVEALSTFFVLASTMTNGAFSLLAGIGTMARRYPSGLQAWRAGSTGAAKVFGGGHVIAERRFEGGLRDIVDGWSRRIANMRAADPAALLLTIAFFYAITSCAIRLFIDPSWANFGLYAASVFAISLCIRQVGKFARLATAFYPVTLLFFYVIAIRASLTLRSQRARGKKTASR